MQVNGNMQAKWFVWLISAFFLNQQPACAEDKGLGQGLERSKQRDFSFLSDVFPGTSLKVCSKVGSLTEESCTEKQYYVAYMTWKLFLVQNGLEVSRISEFSTFDKFSKKSLDGANSENEYLVQARYFYEIEAPLLSKCLAAECGDVFDFSVYSKQEWAIIWKESMALHACLLLRNPNNDKPMKVYDAGIGIQFDLAKKGHIGDCPPKGIHDEAFSIGSRVALPGNSF
jgi:hypothetical protein